MQMGIDTPAFRHFVRPATLARWLIVVLLLGSIWLVVNYSTVRDYYAALALRNRNRNEVNKLEAEYQQQLQEKKELENWGFAAEKTVRERFRMVRPGEKVILIEIEKPADANDRPEELDYSNLNAEEILNSIKIVDLREGKTEVLALEEGTDDFSDAEAGEDGKAD